MSAYWYNDFNVKTKQMKKDMVYRNFFNSKINLLSRNTISQQN